ncbi:MAG TPA: YihY/virulence factor BrkB family protein [Gammaproteobacteria bacterium]|nr:YihY/virulence factor BrkB family protein [Gammaproteobacteria bacterium]
MTRTNGGRHGRGANGPAQIPAPGWRDVALRVLREMSRDNLFLVAAGVAYYWLLAVFPALALLLSVYGLASDPHQVARQLTTLSAILPGTMITIVGGQMEKLAGAPGPALGIGVVVGALVALVSAMWGTAALMTALNIVYDESERRSLVRLYGVALALTVAALLLAVLALLLIVAAPAVLAAIPRIGTAGGVAWVVGGLRWPVLAVAMMVFLALAFRYGPSRARAKWRWISWGAVLATGLWLVASWLFSFYVSHFASFNKTYGSLGALVIFLVWFYVSAYVILLAAEVDAEVEHQTGVDTTVGPDRPMGERGAYVADTLGPGADKPGRR